MKGPNPFSLWEDDPGGISGRRDEMRSITAFVESAASGQAGVLLVTGIPGSGKSSMLRYLKSQAERAGLLSPYVNAEKGEGESAVADKLHQELAAGAPGTGRTPSSFESLVQGIGAGKATVLIIDNIDRMKRADDAVSAIVGLARAGWGKRKIAFAISSTRVFKEREGPVGSIVLGPLEEHEAREMIDKALKSGQVKMGDECFNSLMADTEGNPKLLKRICHDIYTRLRDNEKVISKGHYLAYLPQILGSLSREWFGKMYQETPNAEREILQAIAKEEGGIHVSDVARSIGKPLGPVTALTRRLLERGQITRMDRGKYRVFSRLYAKYVAQRS
ncbi:MAG: AAA family ATPase [Candidatus Micrarchaeota archaeon]